MNTEIVLSLNLIFLFHHQSFVLDSQVCHKHVFHFGCKVAKLSDGSFIKNVYFSKYALTDELLRALLL